VEKVTITCLSSKEPKGGIGEGDNWPGRGLVAIMNL
jgi:hypothetical protein